VNKGVMVAEASAVWCDYGGATAKELVATKRKNGGTEEEE